MMNAPRKIAWLNAPFARNWYALRPGARILMYHRVSETGVTNALGPDQLSVSPGLFARQMQWLSQNRFVLPLTELLQRAVTGGTLANRVAITFDDGYLDNLTHALPVLDQYAIPATLYITAGFASQKIRHPRYQQEPGRLHLDWPEVLALSKHPLIEIGSHTLTHPMLSELGVDQALAEIRHSKIAIEQQIQKRVNSFCYPAGNFSDSVRQMVQQQGYRNAVSVKPGVNRSNCNLFALKRTEITYKDEPANLALKLDGAYDLLHIMLDIRREKQFAQQRKAKP